MKKVEIGSLLVDVFTSLEQVTDIICRNYMDSPSSAVAINPEKVVASATNSELRDILVSNDILFADGIGVVKLMALRSGNVCSRIPGCELWESLMAYCGKKEIPVFVLGSTKTTVEKTVLKLKGQYGTQVADYSDGFFVDDVAMIQRIKSSNAKFVSVAMGSPKQELFIARAKQMGVNAFFLGVGGTYDVYTHKVQRAPKIFCDNGFEWLYRLLKEPKRIFRQTSLLKFIWLAVFRKI